MSEDDRRPGVVGALTWLFSSVGGLLTALATLIAGVLAILALVNRSDNGDGDSVPTPPSIVTTSEGPETPSGPTLAEWRSQANAVCEGADIEFELSPEGQADERIRALEVGRQTARTFHNTTDSLRDLDTPDSEASQVEEMISSWERGTDAFESFLAAFERGDQPSAQADQTRATTQMANGNRLARRLGATTCAERVFGEQ